jgi:hypothetical protein
MIRADEAMIDRRELYKMTRDQLIARAGKLGVSRPEVLTQAELTDEIISRSTSKPRRRKMRGWLGRARDLVARVVERGLHLPDAAKRFTTPPSALAAKAPPPLPTMTLAEIYAAQGYLAKAVEVLDEVLASDQAHQEAQRLCDKLVQKLSAAELRKRQERLATQAAPESVRPDEACAVAALGPGKNDTDEHASQPMVDGQDPSLALAQNPGPATESSLLLCVDRQELVALATNAHTAYVYWDMQPRRFARLRAAKPNGRLVLRLLCMSNTGKASNHDLYVDALRGDTFVHGLLPEAKLHFCIGYKCGEVFDAIVVGEALSMPRDYRQELGVAAPPQQTAVVAPVPLGATGVAVATVAQSAELERASASSEKVASTHLRDGIPRWASARWVQATASVQRPANQDPHTPSGVGLGQWAAGGMTASGAGMAGWSKSGHGIS